MNHVFYVYRNPTGRAGLFCDTLQAPARWGLAGLRIDLRPYFGGIKPKYQPEDFRSGGGSNFSDREDPRTHVPSTAVLEAARAMLVAGDINKYQRVEITALVEALT